ncbi:MAG: homocysteine S-methyltransferase family protein [Coriobacteriaceae bacterium]|nr:homocysteine S-methyltransferase family protein [Coriobacteriaceae bacterium]
MSHDREFINLIEPEVVRDAYRLELAAGAQCLVTQTAGITRARLAHTNREDQAAELAQAALCVVNSLRPQHVFAEIGPCGLPLDSSNEASLEQSRAQYAQAAEAFGEGGFDAFFLNGMTHPADMRCALEGVRAVTQMPIIASLDLPFQADAVEVRDQSILGEEEGLFWPGGSGFRDAFMMMEACGAAVVGFASTAPLELVCAYAKRLRAMVSVPLLVQLSIGPANPKQMAATAENPYFCPDVLIEAATELRGAKVQFLRACGNARPAYTGALAIASSGFDVLTRKEAGADGH